MWWLHGTTSHGATRRGCSGKEGWSKQRPLCCLGWMQTHHHSSCGTNGKIMHTIYTYKHTSSIMYTLISISYIYNPLPILLLRVLMLWCVCICTLYTMRCSEIRTGAHECRSVEKYTIGWVLTFSTYVRTHAGLHTENMQRQMTSQNIGRGGGAKVQWCHAHAEPNITVGHRTKSGQN